LVALVPSFCEIHTFPFKYDIFLLFILYVSAIWDVGLTHKSICLFLDLFSFIIFDKFHLRISWISKFLFCLILLCKKPVAYKFDYCCPGWRKLIGRIGPNNEWKCVAFVREMQKLWHFWFFFSKM
jgi:hypothetical protein